MLRKGIDRTEGKANDTIISAHQDAGMKKCVHPGALGQFGPVL